jgi:hypothetical protein
MSTPRRWSAIGRTLSLATDARVISWPVIIACAALTVLIHLAPNGGTVHGSILVRILLAVLAYLPGLAVIFVFVQLVRRISSARWRIALMLTSYFVAGALRGLVLAVGFYSLGMADSLNLDFRIPGSAIPFGLAIAAATYGISALDESKKRISSLRAMQEELEAVVAESSGRETALRERTISQIEASVHDQLTSIENIRDTATAEELRVLATKVVRPLSHDLAQRVPVWQSPTIVESPRIRWRDVFAQVRPELSLRPALLTSLTTATALTAFIYFFGIMLAIPLVLSSVALTYASTRILQIVTVRLNGIPNLALRALVITLLLMAASLPPSLVATAILHDTADPTFVLRAGLMIVPIFGWFIALGGAAQAESARIEDDITQAIAELSWLRARLNLVNWFEQGEFARVLHGPVQSAINKGIIQLTRGNAGVSRAAVLNEVRSDISRALEPTLRWDGENRNLDELCSALATTWESLAQIDFAMSPAAKGALANDPACASLSWDVIHESCENAIRHGKANWISVRIGDPRDRLVTVDVVDNGSEYVVDSQPGLGSNMLDACAVEWSREREDSQTTLRTLLPIVS